MELYDFLSHHLNGLALLESILLWRNKVAFFSILVLTELYFIFIVRSRCGFLASIFLWLTLVFSFSSIICLFFQPFQTLSDDEQIQPLLYVSIQEITDFFGNLVALFKKPAFGISTIFTYGKLAGIAYYILGELFGFEILTGIFANLIIILPGISYTFSSYLL